MRTIDLNGWTIDIENMCAQETSETLDAVVVRDGDYPVATVESFPVAELFAAAGNMAVELARLEWRDVGLVSNCAACGRRRELGHVPWCSLDAALDKAGIHDALRRELRGER
jgi:hypothetical protein